MILEDNIHHHGIMTKLISDHWQIWSSIIYLVDAPTPFIEFFLTADAPTWHCSSMPVVLYEDSFLFIVYYLLFVSKLLSSKIANWWGATEFILEWLYSWFNVIIPLCVSFYLGCIHVRKVCYTPRFVTICHENLNANMILCVLIHFCPLFLFQFSPHSGIERET